MNLDNFLVRPKRSLVEKYAKAEAWTTLREEEVAERSNNVASLPTARDAADPQEAKVFDLLMLQSQLSLLRGDPRFEKLQTQLRGIASLPEEQAATPSAEG